MSLEKIKQFGKKYDLGYAFFDDNYDNQYYTFNAFKVVELVEKLENEIKVLKEK